jgi:hypothetical protein
MIEELQRRNFASGTIHAYVHGVEHFSQYLGDHLKTGHTLSLQNRPTEVAEDVIVLPCGCVRLQGAV